MQEFRIVKLRILLLILSLCVLSAPSPVLPDAEGAKAIPSYLSQRLYGLPGLKNMGKVASGIYRGAQPEGEGYQTLKDMGIKTIVNLRAFHSEREAVTSAGMRSIEIPINIFRSVDPKAIERAVAAIADPDNQPVYLHCAFGEDRTGTVVAVFRISRQGWPASAAMEEMEAFGFHDIWVHLKHFLENYPGKPRE
jgi:tyrosine-protein phosphatase SIW14